MRGYASILCHLGSTYASVSFQASGLAAPDFTSAICIYILLLRTDEAQLSTQLDGLLTVTHKQQGRGQMTED